MTGFSLKDHLFNAETVGQLAGEIKAAHPSFQRDAFVAQTLSGFDGRELKDRIEWIADCLETQAPNAFADLADWIEAALPEPLDPTLKDDDFGHFIHSPWGVLIARHGMGDVERSLSALHAITQRFSMEYAIRDFLRSHPDQTLERMAEWVLDDNYHVRRLVSEGTRPTLPWSARIGLELARPLPLLDVLHADPARFVTRSVANHLNDISKTDAALVHGRLGAWERAKRQEASELKWLTAHALRTLIKQGDPQAMERLGYRSDAAVAVQIAMPAQTRINDVADIKMTLSADQDTPVLVDYSIDFLKADGSQKPKVFKVKQAIVKAGKPLVITKKHRFKGDATTFRLYPGTQGLSIMVNGTVRAAQTFELLDAPS